MQGRRREGTDAQRRKKPAQIIQERRSGDQGEPCDDRLNDEGYQTKGITVSEKERDGEENQKAKSRDEIKIKNKTRRASEAQGACRQPQRSRIAAD